MVVGIDDLILFGTGMALSALTLLGVSLLSQPTFVPNVNVGGVGVQIQLIPMQPVINYDSVMLEVNSTTRHYAPSPVLPSVEVFPNVRAINDNQILAYSPTPMCIDPCLSQSAPSNVNSDKVDIANENLFDIATISSVIQKLLLAQLAGELLSFAPIPEGSEWSS